LQTFAAGLVRRWSYTSSVMNRLARYWRAQPWCLGLLLLALLLRGLIPVGYMPAVEHGALVLELCTAQQYRVPFAHTPVEPGAQSHDHDRSGGNDAAGNGLVGASQAGESASHSQQHNHNGTVPAGHNSPCPFAATALSAPPPVSVAYAIALDSTRVDAAHAPQISSSLIVSRSQSARAPPVLS
jgi:hypothetical protein